MTHIAQLPQRPAAVAEDAITPLDLPIEQFSAALERRSTNRTALLQWLQTTLREGVDYGRIHVVGRSKCSAGSQCQNPAHFSKPCLFKPGAEKIGAILGLTAHFPTLPAYEKVALQGTVLEHFILRCELRDGAGRTLADGVGARSLKQDYGDLNKTLKMCEKSAQIDATLRVVGLSELYTQDLEDWPEADRPPPWGGGTDPTAADRAPRSSPTPPAPTAAAPAKVSDDLRKRLFATAKATGLDSATFKDAVKKRWKLQSFNDLESPAAQWLLDHMPDFAEKYRQSLVKGLHAACDRYGLDRQRLHDYLAELCQDGSGEALTLAQAQSAVAELKRWKEEAQQAATEDTQALTESFATGQDGKPERPDWIDTESFDATKQAVKTYLAAGQEGATHGAGDSDAPRMKIAKGPTVDPQTVVAMEEKISRDGLLKPAILEELGLARLADLPSAEEAKAWRLLREMAELAESQRAIEQRNGQPAKDEMGS